MRLKLTGLLLGLVFLAISARLFYWQIIRGQELSKEAQYQYKDVKQITAPRGNIYASDGSGLAVGQTSWLIYADIPNVSWDKEDVAETVSAVLYEKEDILEKTSEIYSNLTRKEIVWSPLVKNITGVKKDELEKLNIPGIGFEATQSRFYPEGSSSAQLLGFVGKEKDGTDIGYFGLEGYYELALSGKTGTVSRQKDLRGAPIVGHGINEVSSISGASLTTNIDKRIQILLEEKLKEGIEKYGAVGASGVVLNPKTGAVLAMSSLPSFDPIKYYDYNNDLFKNPVVSDIFEPGSVFKVVVMASALDSGKVKSDTICDICNGPLKVDKYLIETWDKKYRDNPTMKDVIVFSDNVGMSFVAQEMGQDLLHDYLNRFGFGKVTNIDLQGEVPGLMKKKGTWNIVDLATTSFGQGISVTPIQLVSAVSAIANEGMLMQPQLVKKIEVEGWVDEIKPKEVSRVIGKKAASEITMMMEEAARNGEAKWTNTSGFRVAGKTGTAQIPISGHYDEEKTIASFVGFAPSNDPKFVMLITLHEPQSSPWASETAAPLWYSIAKELFGYFGIQPNN